MSWKKYKILAQITFNSVQFTVHFDQMCSFENFMSKLFIDGNSYFQFGMLKKLILSKINIGVLSLKKVRTLSHQ